MRKLNIATKNETSIDFKVPLKYKFIEKIASQLSTTVNETKVLFDVGIKEFESFKKSNGQKIKNDKIVWHIKQHLINNLPLTTKEINKLKKINLLLKKQEERIKIHSDKLRKSLNNQINKKLIDDFEFQTSYSLFTNDIGCNKKYKVEEGEPFYQDFTYSLFRENMDSSFYKNDWNENLNPQLHFNMCYTMHCLMYHSNIAVKDILLISDVWIELKVGYQFLIQVV